MAHIYYRVSLVVWPKERGDSVVVMDERFTALPEATRIAKTLKSATKDTTGVHFVGVRVYRVTEELLV